MSIQQHIVLRYRAPGHVRFALPKRFLEATALDELRAALFALQGFRRLDVYARQGKLSLRFDEAVCPFSAVLETLYAWADKPRPSSGFALAVRQGSSGLKAWLHEKAKETRETLSAAAVLLRRLTPQARHIGHNGEKFVLEFFTDVLVLYLIKTHWHLITQHWLRRPWQYRYEWLASWYLIFLLVRSRRPKS